jgi:hypothetical protein
MTPARSIVFTALAATLCVGGLSPVAAQDYAPYNGARYEGSYGYDRVIPPRSIPDARYGYHRYGPAETVVTTTRRVVTTPGYDEAPRTVVTTTRRMVAPAAVDETFEDDGAEYPPLPPPRRIITKSESPYAVLPPRRVVATEIDVPPPMRVITRRAAPPAGPVIIEERRVETTRRIIRPATPDWE